MTTPVIDEGSAKASHDSFLSFMPVLTALRRHSRRNCWKNIADLFRSTKQITKSVNFRCSPKDVDFRQILQQVLQLQQPLENSLQGSRHVVSTPGMTYGHGGLFQGMDFTCPVSAARLERLLCVIIGKNNGFQQRPLTSST